MDKQPKDVQPSKDDFAKMIKSLVHPKPEPDPQLLRGIYQCTPPDLAVKYKNKLSKPETIFVNLLVFESLQIGDAYQIAFKKQDKSDLYCRTMGHRQLQPYYKGGYIKDYYEELLAYNTKLIHAQVNWSKEDSIRELAKVVAKVNEEEKPYFDEDKLQYVNPPITKAKADAKINAISEIDKIMGYTDSKTDLGGQVSITFTGEKEMEDYVNGHKGTGSADDKAAQ